MPGLWIESKSRRGRMSPFFVACLGVVLVSVSGCGGLLQLPKGGPAPDLYTLNAASDFSDPPTILDIQLVVDEPIAVAGLETNQMVLRLSSNKIEYIDGARWVNRVPRMVQALLLETLENSGAFHGVGRQAMGMRADYALKLDLREFAAELNGANSATARVRLAVTLIDYPSLDVVSARSFEAEESVRRRGPAALAPAFDRALQKVLSKITAWTQETLADN